MIHNGAFVFSENEKATKELFEKRIRAAKRFADDISKKGGIDYMTRSNLRHIAYILSDALKILNKKEDRS